MQYFTAQPIAGGEFEYYYNYNPNNHVERVCGTFDSQTQAHGDAYFMIPSPSNPASYCISLPDWTASHAAASRRAIWQIALLALGHQVPGVADLGILVCNGVFVVAL